MPVRYDPSRHTREFQEHMNSEEVSKAHKKIFGRMSTWKKRYRKWWNEKERQELEGADE